MPESPKTVLMLQLDDQQGKIWDAALHSQGLQVDWRPTNVDVVEMLKQSKSLPDLLVMDIGVKSPNSNSLQVVPVCNWCRSLDTPLKVLLLNSSSLLVKAYEQKWATGKCAALGIVPKLSQTSLNNTVSLIMEILGGNLNVEALENVSDLITDIYTENLALEISKIRNEIAASPKEISPKVTPISSYRGASLDTPKSSIENIDISETRIQPPAESIPEPVAEDPAVPKTKVTTYRGVKVKKIQW